MLGFETKNVHQQVDALRTYTIAYAIKTMMFKHRAERYAKGGIECISNKGAEKVG